MKGYTSLLLPVFLTLSAFAADISTSTSEDLLIEKLSRIQMQLSLKDPSKVPVTLRLADLYAERARQHSLKELSDGCSVCEAGKSDREMALKFYLEVLEKVNLDQKSSVMLQVGHLYEMNNQELKAIDYYQSILKNSASQNSILESHYSLAEIYFKKRQFSEAFDHYSKVAESRAASRGRAAYRAAWCLFNKGDLAKSSAEFEKILQSPDLLSQAVGAQNQTDAQFQEEVLRDWITVLSQDKWKASGPEQLFKLSPENLKIPLLSTLALELERIGRKTEALQTWNFAFENISDPKVKLQAHLHRAVLMQDTDLKKATENFNFALESWKALPDCQNHQCEEEAKILKQFVIGWHKKEKMNPSIELVSAYENYLGVFPADTSMHLWLAELTEQISHYSVAMREYQKASLGLENDEKENALIKQIEMAEKQKSNESVVLAQDFYLQNSVKRSKEHEVKYQKLHQIYEKAQYEEAFLGLKALALDEKVPSNLKNQAADLALDCLVLLKDDEKLQATSHEFSLAFKGEESTEFFNVYQKTLLSKSAKLAELGQTEAAYQNLDLFDAKKAPEADQIIFFKNKILLSEKLNRFAEARPLLDSLLAVKSIGPSDRDFVWTQKAYLAELFLDFKSARMATELVTVKNPLEEKTKIMKLALFTELLGEKAVKPYQELLKKASDESERNLILSKMIKNSDHPETDLLNSKSQFTRSPEVYSRLALELNAKKPSKILVKSVLNDKAFDHSSSGQVLQTASWIEEFKTLKTSLQNHQLDSAKQKNLAASLKSRIKMIDQLEKQISVAISRKDWTAQLLGLDLLAKESQRFYQDLLSAPLPQGLTAEEEQSYLSLLSAQAAPYQSKGADAAAKVQEFWAATDWKKDFETSMKDEVLRFYAQNEINQLSEIAADENKKYFAVLLTAVPGKNSGAGPSLAELEVARNKVRENPLNKENLKSLRELESQSQNTAMVQYLEIREKELQ